MIYRVFVIKHALKLIIAMAAVLAGLTNLSIVPLLSQRQDLPKRQDIKKNVRLTPFRVTEMEKEYLPQEPPPVLKPKISRNHAKFEINNMKRVMPNHAIELADIKQDLKIKLPPISLKTDMNCPRRLLKNRHTPMNISKRCFDMDEVDVIPLAVSAAQPFYPYRAKRLSTGGYVNVRFLVDTNGDVSKLIIVDSNPRGIFEQSVRETVPKWKFKPGRKDGKPVRTWLRKTIEFTLDGNS